MVVEAQRSGWGSTGSAPSAPFAKVSGHTPHPCPSPIEGEGF